MAGGECDLLSECDLVSRGWLQGCGSLTLVPPTCPQHMAQKLHAVPYLSPQ